MNSIVKAECKLAHKERRIQLQLVDCKSTASRHCFSDDVYKYILLHLGSGSSFYFFVRKHAIFLLYIEFKKLLLCLNCIVVENKKTTLISFSKYSGYSKHKYVMFFLYKIIIFVYIIIILRIFHKHLRMLHS